MSIFDKLLKYKKYDPFYYYYLFSSIGNCVRVEFNALIFNSVEIGEGAVVA